MGLEYDESLAHFFMSQLRHTYQSSLAEYLPDCSLPCFYKTNKLRYVNIEV